MFIIKNIRLWKFDRIFLYELLRVWVLGVLVFFIDIEFF